MLHSLYPWGTTALDYLKKLENAENVPDDRQAWKFITPNALTFAVDEHMKCLALLF